MKARAGSFVACPIAMAAMAMPDPRGDLAHVVMKQFQTLKVERAAVGPALGGSRGLVVLRFQR